MLFNSIEFLFFLPVVFALYWFVFNKDSRVQNLLLLISSYFFYGFWSWQFLILLATSTLLDYLYGFSVASNNRRKAKFFLWLSILNNLGILCLFKYYDFFAIQFQNACERIGLQIHPYLLQFALPIGISFYTFHGMSYVFDIYKGKQEPIKNFIDYAVFVAFFPLLVAGPIERATHLLPQFQKKRTFEYANSVNGLRQILWGLFKKIVIADNCAEYANLIFNNSQAYAGSTLVLGALFFTFQIYGDFSGYSDIALGTARLFGIELIRNFNFPYFARDIAEFWRRWHISLSSWFRDYLYIPLGGSQGGTWMKVRNTFIIFIVSGFWHGANWTFIVWGTLNAVYFLPLLLTNKNRSNLETVAQGKLFPSLKELIHMLLTFSLTVFAWIFFRAKDLSHALSYIKGILSHSIYQIPKFAGMPKAYMILSLVGIFMMIEWIGRENQFAIERLGLTWKRSFRWGFYFILLACLFIFSGNEQQFIYFQF